MVKTITTEEFIEGKKKKEKKPKEIKPIEYKPGMSIRKYVKQIIKIEKNKDRLKWLKSFDNCVLPTKVESLINEAIVIVLNKDKFEKWGLNEHFEKGITNSILLYGESGTGKTMVSESIASILNKPLIKVDNALLQSNIPGEMERNIEMVFNKAKDDDAVLLIDECDSLLYNRDAVGFVLGSEINKLLTEIERFNGIVILTTNRLKKLDKALQRRIIAKVNLPRPNEKIRFEIWKKLIPKKLPLATDVDLKKLADYDLSGGDIKNAVILASRKAIAENKSEVTQQHFNLAILSILESKKEYDEGEN